MGKIRAKPSFNWCLVATRATQRDQIQQWPVLGMFYGLVGLACPATVIMTGPKGAFNQEPWGRAPRKPGWKRAELARDQCI
jgi:hypothetical protein